MPWTLRWQIAMAGEAMGAKGEYTTVDLLNQNNF